jgi:hypothetical protein
VKGEERGEGGSKACGVEARCVLLLCLFRTFVYAVEWINQDLVCVWLG